MHSESGDGTVYLQVVECFALVTFALMISWVICVEIGAT